MSVLAGRFDGITAPDPSAPTQVRPRCLDAGIAPLFVFVVCSQCRTTFVCTCRRVRRRWCWRWATGARTWCACCWRRAPTWTCRTTTARRRSCAPVNMATPTSSRSCSPTPTATRVLPTTYVCSLSLSLSLSPSPSSPLSVSLSPLSLSLCLSLLSLSLSLSLFVGLFSFRLSILSFFLSFLHWNKDKREIVKFH